MDKDVYTLNELVERFNVQKSSVMRWLRQGLLPARRLEEGYNITEADFEAFFNTPDGQALAITGKKLAAAREGRRALNSI